MERRSIQPPFPLLWASFWSLIGILLAEAVEPSWALCLALLSGAATFFFLKPNCIGAYACVMLLVGSAHVWRHQLCPSRQLAQRLPADGVEAVNLCARVNSTPNVVKKSLGRTSVSFRAQIESIFPVELWVPDSEILVHWPADPPTCGDRIEVRTILKRISPARNPGEFDRALHYGREYVWVEAFVRSPADAHRIERAGWNLKTTVAEAREWISLQLLRGIEDQPQIHKLISSMVLGLGNASLEEMQQIFRDLGAVHLFAVSGLNLSMLAAFWSFILSFSPVLPRANSAATAFVLKGYAIVTGLSASCGRALVMALLSLGIAWVRRPVVVLNSLGAAALLLLALDGNTAFKTGAQLSFGLVLSLILLSPLIARSIQRFFMPDPLLPQRLWTVRQRSSLALGARGAQMLSTALVAWLTSLPWNCLVFHQLSLASIWVNLVAVPISFVNLVLGFTSLLCFSLGPIPLMLNRINAGCASWLLTFVSTVRTRVGAPFAIPNPFESRPALVAFDLSEGAAVALREGERWWLFDCGNEKAVQSIVTPALCGYGVNVVEALVLSHGDVDHIGGAVKVCERFRAPRIFASPMKSRSVVQRRVYEELARSGRAVSSVKAGDVVVNDPKVRVEVLYPPESRNGVRADDNSLVIRWSTREWTILYTSDAGLPTERWLLENVRECLRADIWIRGSHKIEQTGSGDFVAAVAPRLIVVSGFARYGTAKVDEQWVERRRREGIAVWLQKQSGAVLGWTGSSVRMRSFLGGEELDWRAD